MQVTSFTLPTSIFATIVVSSAIKDEDRFLHVYVIGKTGTGKSTLIETMALQDLERGNGFALIDPHGDLVARVAARIPASHPDKVIYLDATDPTQPYNPLRHVSEDRIALAASKD
jgi:DNA helicase HerA-like ATPase